MAESEAGNMTENENGEWVPATPVAQSRGLHGIFDAFMELLVVLIKIAGSTMKGGSDGQ